MDVSPVTLDDVEKAQEKVKMKDKLQKMLSGKNERKAELVKSIEASESIDDIKRFSAELDKLNGEIRDIEGMLNDLPTEEEARTDAVNAPIPSVVKTEAAEERKAPAEVKEILPLSW